MQISKRRVNHLLDKQILDMWYQLIVDIKTKDEARLIMDCLLSKTESVAVTKRLAVGYWLSKKRSYGNIKENIKVSSATIAGVADMISSLGWKSIIKRVTAEEWATRMNDKIKSLVGMRSHS